VQGALTGTMEVWLEPVLDGTLLHYFLRADPPTPYRRMKDRLAAIRTRQVAAKAIASTSSSPSKRPPPGRRPLIPPREWLS